MANEIPQTPLGVPSSAYFPGTPATKKAKSSFIKIIIGIIVILVLGTGISLATRIWDPLWNPFRPSPEKVIDRMSQKMREVKTNHSEMKFEFGVREETKVDLEKKEVSGGEFQMTMAFNIDADNTDPQNPKSAGDFNMVMSLSGMSISLAGEIIGIGDTSYFKFTTINLPFLPSPIQSQVRNQWIQYDEKSKEKEEGITKKLEALLKDKKFFLVQKEFADEKIENQAVYHYLVVLDKEEIKKILPELLKTMEGYNPSLMPLAGEESSSKLNAFIEKIGEITAEIWVGKKDNYLYKVKGEKEIDLSIFSQEQRGTITIKFEVASSNFNQPVKIEPPTEYGNFEEILGLLFPSLTEAKTSASDAQIISDLFQIVVIADKINYDFKSYENLCTEPPNNILNETAPSYGEDLADFQKDIREQQGGILDLICLDSAISFCVEADLISVGKGRYCIDNSWKTQEITDDQTCLGTGTTKNPYRCP